jgi:EAL domain-containing protein (putative c-di-GMP-specific phosphodiesterase class I)
VAPDIVQLDLRLPGRKDRSHAGVQQLLAAAAAAGARVMAVGVDTTIDREAAASLGAVLARGASYGRPGPLPPV